MLLTQKRTMVKTLAFMVRTLTVNAAFSVAVAVKLTDAAWMRVSLRDWLGETSPQ